MNPLVACGIAVGGLLLVQQTPAGAVLHEEAGSATLAAMQALKDRGKVAGVSFLVEPNKGSLANFVTMRAALVGNLGELAAEPNIPANLSLAQLQDVIDAWLEAYRAGRDKAGANGLANFSLSGCTDAMSSLIDSKSYYAAAAAGVVPMSLTCGDAQGDIVKLPYTKWHLSSLGLAVCAVLDFERKLNWTYGDEDVVQAFTLLAKLAGEMDGADFTVPGVRPADGNWTFDDIVGGIGAGLEADVTFVGHAAEEVATAVLDNSLIWFVVLGAVAWKVML